MKKILCFVALLGFINHASAQNTFPTAVDTKVGIGTITPVYPLDVRGDVNVANVLHFANNTATMFSTTDTHPTIYSTSNGGTVYPFLSAGNLVIQSRASGAPRDIVFVGNTTPTTQMIIQGATGRVGIGNTNPGVPFHIGPGGNLSMVDGAGAPTTGQILNSQTSGVAIIEAAVQDGTNNRRIGLFVDQPNGLVGLSSSYSSGNPAFVYRNASTGELFRITNVGNVGIGSTTPQSALEVKSGAVNIPSPLVGSIASFGRNGHASISIVANPVNTSSIYFANTGNIDAGAIVYDNSTNTMGFRTNNTNSQMVVNATGNVGIGTTDTKGYKLAVNGSAIATSMTVKLNSAWPDYVFKKGYQLLPLSEVKTYIDKNQHLPDMPSEKEVAENGLNLGEMNKQLTKKIEELTLYLIEENKKNVEQKELIQMQEIRLQKLEKLISGYPNK